MGHVRMLGGTLMAIGMVVVSVTAADARGYGRGPRELASSATDVRAAAKRGKGCADRLANQVYSCTVAAEGGGTFQDCLRFSAPGVVSDEFDLTTDAQSLTLGCTCKAKGSSKKPKFGALPIFVCTGDDVEGDYVFEANVAGSGKKITKGFVSNGSGGSFVFDCKVDPACAVAP